MLTRDQFIHKAMEAYEHLYDLVYLRSHPLLDLLGPDDSSNRKGRAWQLHNLLLENH